MMRDLNLLLNLPPMKSKENFPIFNKIPVNPRNCCEKGNIIKISNKNIIKTYQIINALLS